MGFLDDLLKRAMGSAAGDQDGGGSPTRAENQESDPPVKEIRTTKRNGGNSIEEYERLNADGTVTKTITMEDNSGNKKVEIYKMDKSGIVRRVDDGSQEDRVPSGVIEDMWIEEMKRMKDAALGTPYQNKSLVQQTPRDLELRTLANNLGPERRAAIFNEYKQKLLSFGTSRLQDILWPKLEDSGPDIDLTNEQKSELVDYGTQKIQKLLEKSVDEERFFNEVWPRYVIKNMATNSAMRKSPKSVSFNLQANNNSAEDYNKTNTVSFVIRPETRQDKQMQYNKYVKTAEKGENIESKNELKKPEELLLKVKRAMTDYVLKNNTMDKECKEDRLNYIDKSMQKVSQLLKESDLTRREEINKSKPVKTEKLKSKEERMKKPDFSQYFDAEDIIDYGLKSLKKIFKKKDSVDAKIVGKKEGGRTITYEDDIQEPSKNQYYEAGSKDGYDKPRVNNSSSTARTPDFPQGGELPSNNKQRMVNDYNNLVDHINNFMYIYSEGRALPSKQARIENPEEKQAIDFNTLISKLEKNLNNNLAKDTNSRPRFSSSPSSQTTSHYKSESQQRNQQRPDPFGRQQIQYEEQQTQKPSEPLGRQQINFETQNSQKSPDDHYDDGFVPWWFGNNIRSSMNDTNTKIKEPTKRLLPFNDPFYDDFISGDSFFSKGFGAPTLKPQLKN